MTENDIPKTKWRILDYPMKENELEEAKVMVDGLLQDLYIELKPEKFNIFKKWLTENWKMIDNRTEVVNIKKDDYDVYIGRGSKWGNPFVIGRDGTRSEVIKKYEKYLANNQYLLNSLEELREKKLGCHCKPLACHGDILVKFIKFKVK